MSGGKADLYIKTGARGNSRFTEKSECAGNRISPEATSLDFPRIPRGEMHADDREETDLIFNKAGRPVHLNQRTR